jgi:acyl-CoA synthetase
MALLFGMGSSVLLWSQLLNWVDNISAQFAQAGLRKGDRVAIWLPSCAEGVASFLACSRNGYVACTSLHQNYTLQKLVNLSSAAAQQYW